MLNVIDKSFSDH